MARGPRSWEGLHENILGLENLRSDEESTSLHMYDMYDTDYGLRTIQWSMASNFNNLQT